MKYKDIVLAITKEEINTSNMVTILQLISNELDLQTVSSMARKENKSPQGIRKSKRYNKIVLGGRDMVYKLNQ
jgi:hypothetical protein|tara:strand:- start:2795 stop:3013 length:219 start_codon:yes stop_codon:yes gene_type:complete